MLKNLKSNGEKGTTMNERKYVAVSIKHSAYKWRYGAPDRPKD